MNKFNPNAPKTLKIIKAINSWKSNAFLLFKLPSVLFWGGRIVKTDHKRCEIKLPCRWSSNNPFRSIYFAAQAGAAELSTGILAKIAIEGRGKISMLVREIHCEFYKKATSTTYFVCEEGEKIIAAVDKAIETREGQAVTIKSVGKIKDGTVTCVATLTWSFKVKS